MTSFDIVFHFLIIVSATATLYAIGALVFIATAAITGRLNGRF